MEVRVPEPWHGIPREDIGWHPRLNEDACIGCGMCVTGCARGVFGFDYDRKKPVVQEPLQCLVGCNTCATTCPTHALQLPEPATIRRHFKDPRFRHRVEDELLRRRGDLEAHDPFPHPDRVVRLAVEEIRSVGDRTRILQLRPQTPGDGFCQFIPGQYVEVWLPSSVWLSRAYSIGNAPRPDGGIELQIRKVEEGRFTTWVFEKAKAGDVVRARGPLGRFVVDSAPEVPLLFVARGTGFAPIKAMVEQQARGFPSRDVRLFWGVTRPSDFYALDELRSWRDVAPGLRVVLTARESSSAFAPPPGIVFEQGAVYEALSRHADELAGRDAYVAGPTSTLTEVLSVLRSSGLPRERIRVDSFGE
jgi:CDP-4-dehydro-6-deoxyglucose reductase